MGVTTTSIETVRDERPSGQVKVATRDLRVPATDSQGREMAEGTVLVARQGRRIPTAFLEHEGVAEYAVTSAEFDAAVESGEIELTALSKADQAAADLAADPAAAAGDDDGDEDTDDETPISRMTKPELVAELEQRGADFDPDATVPVLRDELKAARESDD